MKGAKRGAFLKGASANDFTSTTSRILEGLQVISQCQLMRGEKEQMFSRDPLRQWSKGATLARRYPLYEEMVHGYLSFVQCRTLSYIYQYYAGFSS
jgi:hypothetical protein